MAFKLFEQLARSNSSFKQGDQVAFSYGRGANMKMYYFPRFWQIENPAEFQIMADYLCKFDAINIPDEIVYPQIFELRNVVGFMQIDLVAASAMKPDRPG